MILASSWGIWKRGSTSNILHQSIPLQSEGNSLDLDLDLLTHTMYWEFEICNKFFIWIHASIPCPTWLNSWAHRNLFLKPYLQFLSRMHYLKILILQQSTHKPNNDYLWVPPKNSATVITLSSYELFIDYIGFPKWTQSSFFKFSWLHSSGS
jgi:hypothetical protein